MFLERNRIVLLGVLGGKDQGDMASLGSLGELLECVRTLFEFPSVTPLELIPLVRIVSEPFSQVGAWRQVLEPGVDLKVVLGDAPWPNAIHQNAPTIALCGRTIGAFQADRHDFT